jgi:hypothetical protein
MVRTRTAARREVRHDRAATPSIRTVQAPHTPCLQPTWVPVRRVRAEEIDPTLTSRSTASPLTVSATRARGSAETVGAAIFERRMGSASFSRAVRGERDHPADEGGGDALAVGCRGVHVIRGGHRGLRRLASGGKVASSTRVP